MEWVGKNKFVQASSVALAYCEADQQQGLKQSD